MKHRFIKNPSAIFENVCKSVAGFASVTPISNHSMKSSILCLSLILAALSSNPSAAETKTVDDFRAAATKANAVLTIPDWEQTPEAVEASMKNAIANANAALDQIGAQDLGKVTFKSTVVALDDATYQAGLAANKATIIKQTNTNAAMRAAGENAVKVFQEWAVGIDYREDVYKAIKAFADTHPKLSGEDEKLFNETLRDYRRAGLDLPPDKRKERSHPQKTLRHSRFARSRHECPGVEPNTGVTEQDCVAARLQIMGRFSNRDQDGKIGRRREILHQRSCYRHSAEVCRRSFYV